MHSNIASGQSHPVSQAWLLRCAKYVRFRFTYTVILHMVHINYIALEQCFININFCERQMFVYSLLAEYFEPNRSHYDPDKLTSTASSLKNSMFLHPVTPTT